jgi:sarcosine oxidase
MIRMAYYEHPDYVPLLRRAYERWEQLEKLTGEELLYITGGLYMGPRESEIISGSLNAAQKYNVAHEVIEHGALKQRYPQFELPADHVGMLEPRAGFLVPERVIAACVEDALASGAEIPGQEAVQEWGTSLDSMTVKTNRGEYTCDKIIVCGGAWSGKLLRDLGVELVVTRQVLGWVWPKQPALFELGTLPVWAIDAPGGSIWYGFPMIAGSPGFKLALHARGSATDPDRVNRELAPADEGTFRDCLRRRIPRADGPVLSMRTCLYTNSPDSHFIIDHHPKLPRVILACGFSGHGFKFASVVGEILADYATRGKTDLPAQFLGLSRFAM